MDVQDLDRRHGHPRGVEPSLDVAAEAVENGLDLDLADALAGAPDEGIHGHKLSRGMDFDMALGDSGSIRSDTWINVPRPPLM